MSKTVEMNMDLENKMEETMETATTTRTVNNLKFLIRGSRTAYPGLADMLKATIDGANPAFKLVLEDGKMIGYQGETAIGHVQTKIPDGEGFAEPLELEEFVKSGQVFAKSIGVRQTAAICILEVKEEKKPASTKGKKKEKVGKELKKSLEGEGLTTKKELKERTDYMKACGLTDKQINGVLSSFVDYPDKFKAHIPSKPDVPYVDVSGFLPEVVSYANCKQNLLFEGDKAVGKNVLVETLAWLFKRPVITLSLNADYDNNTLLGTRTIETDESGASVMKFELGVVAEAAQHGCIIVFDEFNTIHPGLMTVFHSLLDKNRKLEVPGYGLIQAHDNFMAIATQNRDYQGTMDNNKATVSRFVPILFPELNDVRNIIERNVPGASKSTLDKVNQVYLALKKMVYDGEIDKEALDIRGLESAVQVFTLMGVPLASAMKTNVANRISDDVERQIVLGMISNLVG